MRLIDADALKKTICYNMPTRADVNILVDAMPDAIVRCKDCKYGDSIKNAKGEPMIDCVLFFDGWLKEPDWFCADGERKGDDA